MHTITHERIKRLFIRIMVLWVMGPVSGGYGHAQMADRIAEFLGSTPQTPHPAVVRVVAQESAASSMGSGCLIWVDGDYGWVISNWHVVRSASGPIEVIFPNGFRSPAQVTKTDETWDLALLGIWRPPVPPVVLAEHVPQVGEDLTIAGYGRGSYRQARGTCRHYAAPDPFQPQEMIELSVTARQGDSGGPILNARGELAGVLFGSGSGLTTGSHVGRVKKFLSDVTATQIAMSPTPMGSDQRQHAVSGAHTPFDPPPFVAMDKKLPSSSLADKKEVGNSPPPFFPSAPVSKPTDEGLVQVSPLAIDELDRLQLGESEPLPFEELARAEPTAKWTRELAHQADAPASIVSPGRDGPQRIARLEDQHGMNGWTSRADNVAARSDRETADRLESNRSPILLEIPAMPAMKGPIHLTREFAEQPIQLPLPLTDTNAFLVFVALVATLIYALPRGTSKEPPGASTIG